MSSIKRRLAKVESEVERIIPRKPTREDIKRRWLDDIQKYGQYFNVFSPLSRLNSRESRQKFMIVLNALEQPYRDMVWEAVKVWGFNPDGSRHPACRLLQYVASVGSNYKHRCRPARIPAQLCEWVLKFDPEEYGYQPEVRADLSAEDVCSGCAICYPTISPPLSKDINIYQELPFKGGRCYECGGAIEDESYSNEMLRERTRRWREIDAEIEAVELPNELDFESWDWEKIIQGI
jgi:hypothetical protein